MRFHAARGSMSLGESDGGLPPDSVVESEAAILADCARYRAISRSESAIDGARRRCAVLAILGDA